MTDMTPARATALRKPFPPESVGKLPKPYKADSPKGKCPECHGYHGLPAVHLDYAGHAAVTDRLLTVDPDWSWEPFAIGPDGLPALDRGNNLWIRLTICGVTRIGVGDGKSAKECIGDAIRNAAMRFGVGLDLWAKENLVEFAQAASVHPVPPISEPATTAAETGVLLDTTSPLARRMFAAQGEAGMQSKEDRIAFCAKVTGRDIESSKELTEAEASAVIEAARDMKAAS